jgi:hypothetical protein
MKTQLKRLRLENIEDIQAESQAILDDIKKREWQRCSQQWERRWTRCMNTEGAT